jgi:hypothetical protein
MNGQKDEARGTSKTKHERESECDQTLKTSREKTTAKVTNSWREHRETSAGRSISCTCL